MNGKHPAFVQRRGVVIGNFTFSYTFCTPFGQADAWRYMKLHFYQDPESPCAIRIYRDFIDL